MLQIDVTNTQLKFRSHLRITSQPNRIPKPHIKKLEDGPNKGTYDTKTEDDWMDIEDWRWQATTTHTENGSTQDANEAGETSGYGQALTEAKAAMKAQYAKLSIPESELSHLDHLE